MSWNGLPSTTDHWGRKAPFSCFALLLVVCHTMFISRRRHNLKSQMTTFLTTAQREFLLEEYVDQLDEMGELEEYGHYVDELRTQDNVKFWKTIVEVMPIYGESVGRKILNRIK